jgi:tetratricopeptide (TPR) repeat protein
MSLKEIEKLRERVEKDPNSKLFVPLAEEYRKEGMLDDAVSVLLKGIEKQPGYMSARVSLGRIYLEKGMPNEARTEFECVVRSIPENLYAQKKLADIYRGTGEKDLAIRLYRTVLKLNAMDEEAFACLRELEDAEEEPDVSFEAAEALTTETPEAGEYAEAVTVAEEAEAVSDVQPEEEPVQGAEIKAVEAEGTKAPEGEAPAGCGESELLAFKDSLFGAPEDTEAEKPGEVSFEEISAVLKDEDTAASEQQEEEPAFAERTAAEEEVAAAPVFSGAVSGRKEPTLDDAERCISEDNYAGAMNIYSVILTAKPGDKRTLQRVGELKALLKLLGKDQEVLIARLNAFLTGIDKRRNEFLRSS